MASSWNEVTPCNMPLDRLAKRSKEGVREAGGYPDRVRHHRRVRRHLHGPRGHAGLARVSARSSPTPSRRSCTPSASTPSLTFAGCDKSLPGMLMAAARLNLPAVFLYGGSILPGKIPGRPDDQALDIVSVFEAVGAHATGLALRRGALAHRAPRLSRPPGRARGCSPPTPWPRWARPSACRCRARPSPSAIDPRRQDFAYESGRAVMELLAPRHPAPRHHDQGGLRERHRRGDGARRLDQRRAPPSRHRQRGAASSSPSTTSTGWRPGCPTSPTPSPTAGTTWSTWTGSAAFPW